MSDDFATMLDELWLMLDDPGPILDDAPRVSTSPDCFTSSFRFERHHVSAILAKLDARTCAEAVLIWTRPEAVSIALQSDLIKPK